MTFLGKMLVMLNAILSFLFLAFAVALFTNQIRWNNYQPEGGEKIVGKIERLLADLKQHNAGRDNAAARYEPSLKSLVDLEKVRPTRLLEYAKELAVIEKKTAETKADNPVHELQPIDARTDLIPLPLAGPQPKAIEYQGQALKSIGDYEELYVTTQAEINQLQAKNKQLIEQHVGLTEDINGVAGKKKGLREFIKEQQTMLAASKAEQEYIEPFRTNSLVEGDLLLKRNSLLTRRVQELNQRAVTSRR
jgi:hypothetical protein